MIRFIVGVKEECFKGLSKESDVPHISIQVWTKGPELPTSQLHPFEITDREKEFTLLFGLTTYGMPIFLFNDKKVFNKLYECSSHDM